MDKRNFIIKGFKAIAAGWGLYFIHSKLEADEKPAEKVKMLTPDGKLVWVDKSVINTLKTAPPVSNKSLRSWMQAKKV